jgi:hypothetical protein
MTRNRQLLTTLLVLASYERVARADATINFFGDLDYNVKKSETATTNSFQASTLDIFAMQTEGKFTFIGELVAEAFGENDFLIDVDRLEVAYKPTSWLRVRAGRIRTSFGYYADAYQNGKFFMVPVSWPEMYEGDGFDGIVPSHAVGVHVDVARELGSDDGKLTLDAEVLNGRGIDLGEIPAFKDEDNSKAVNLRLRYVGEGALEGLIVGTNVFIDSIPADTTVGVEHVAMHELVVAGHLAYVANDIHVVAEAAWFRHRETGRETLHKTLAMFGEAAYAFGDFTPYVRYEYFTFSDADPYFATSGIELTNHHILSTGVKYAASASVSLKLQGSVDHDATSNDYIAITQAAFAF